MESLERSKKRERLLLLEEEDTLEFSSLLEVQGLRTNNREEKYPKDDRPRAFSLGVGFVVALWMSMDAGRRRRCVISRRVRRTVGDGGGVGATSSELRREEVEQRVVTARNPEVKNSE